MAGLLLCFFLLSTLLAVASPSGLNSTLTYSGSYEIRINNKQWLNSADAFVVADGIRYGNNNSAIFSGQVPGVDSRLLLKSAQDRKGQDTLGDFRAMRYEYFAGETQVDMEIRVYDSMVVFSQTFPGGLNNPGVPDDRKVLTGFPAFQWDIVFGSYTADGFLTFSGELNGADAVSTGKWAPLYNASLPPDGINAAGPLCLFNTSSKDVIIISPLTKVMAVSPWHRQWKAGYPRYPITEGQSYWGLDRDLVSVPPGFKAEVILLYSPDGVGKALETWGKALRRYHGTSGVTPPATPFVDKLGYWTGKGSFFYNNTKELDVFNYEQIVLAVKMFADRHQVPLGSVELDDWWYESGITPDAVVTWDANKTSVPDGIRLLAEKLGVPLVLKCGWWSANTTYAEQNNGSYAFIIEGDYSLPMERRFWVDLFQNASEWNVTHVYMDGMATQYYGVTALQRQAGLADDWLRNITSAANETGITLTFSRAIPRMLIAAAQYPSVVQARVSAPYMDKDRTDQWKVGVTSALAGALGLAAFKDTFWSHVQEVDNPYGLNETYPGLQAAVATLSMGSVAIGDSVDPLDFVPPVSKCCRSDGVVLRPSKPATAIDKQIVQEAAHPGLDLGQVWTTVSTVATWTEISRTGVNVTEPYTVGIILAADTRPAGNNYSITPSALFPGVFQLWPELYIWNLAAGIEAVWQPFTDENPFTIPSECWVESATTPCIFYVSHELKLLFSEAGPTKVHLLGENKFVPLSPQRVLYVNLTLGVSLVLQGQPGENVKMTYYVGSDRRQSDVTISSDGRAVLELDVTTTAPLTSPPPVETTEMESTTGGRASALEAS
ncbi:hypothetical protein BaRGS_00012993, partial [Batillaria attramentaria]